MIERKIPLTEELSQGIAYRMKMEDVAESTVIRQLIKFGLIWYVVDLYKTGKITLGEAAELAGVSLKRILDVLAEHGVKGNVKLEQQLRALEYARDL